jgi:hypothetical protein
VEKSQYKLPYLSNQFLMKIPKTVRFVANTRGGCVDTWHIYNPASSGDIGFICIKNT